MRQVKTIRRQTLEVGFLFLFSSFFLLFFYFPTSPSYKKLFLTKERKVQFIKELKT